MRISSHLSGEPRHAGARSSREASGLRYSSFIARLRIMTLGTRRQHRRHNARHLRALVNTTALECRGDALCEPQRAAAQRDTILTRGGTRWQREQARLGRIEGLVVPRTRAERAVGIRQS